MDSYFLIEGGGISQSYLQVILALNSSKDKPLGANWINFLEEIELTILFLLKN